MKSTRWRINAARRSLLGGLAISLALSSSCLAAENIDFASYPVANAYRGKLKQPDFKGRDRDFAPFKTRIMEAMNQGVNFSGEYRITQIGCGSSCSFAILGNLRTGQQFDFPRGGEEVGRRGQLQHATGHLLPAPGRYPAGEREARSRTERESGQPGAPQRAGHALRSHESAG